MISTEYRDRAIAWNNGSRNFDQGIAILKEARFRPGVVRKLEKDKSRPGADERLRVNMRALISAFCIGGEEYNEDTDVELHVYNGVEDVPTATPKAEQGILSHEGDEGNIGLIVKRYADLYRQRDRAFKQMKQVGDKNDEASCILRKQLSESIEDATSKMEQIYPLYSKFIESNVQPSDEDTAKVIEEPSEPKSSPSDSEDSLEDLDSLSKDELTKLQYNLAKRIARSRNKIIYQNENKLDTENPLPADSPKRIKLEKKIAKLEKQLEQVKLKIALIS